MLNARIVNQVFFKSRLDRGGNGVPAKIGKANMDGSDPEVIVKGNLEGPEFLTIDIQKEILYFSTSRNAKIESCNLVIIIFL